MREPSVRLTRLEAYADERGNRIEFEGPPVDSDVSVIFSGRNNVLRLAAPLNIGKLHVRFDCDNGTMTAGWGRMGATFQASVRVGQDSTVIIGNNVTATSPCVMSAVEGTTLRIGDDVMIAGECQIRCDDGHPIFDCR